ncbi:MAG: hydrogenase [Chlamydiota bacterium]
MKEFIDLFMVAIILINFLLISFSYIPNCIRIVAFQGVLIGILPLIFPDHSMEWKTYFICFGTLALKGGIFPYLLFRALKKGSIRQEVEPFIGYKTSMLVTLIALFIAFWVSNKLTIPEEVPALLPVVSLFTTFVGLFIIFSRVKAITQVLGYLVMENGIYLFSFAFLIEQPLIVELGTLLDVFVAVFVMGITIFYIHREFDHMNTKKLSILKD